MNGKNISYKSKEIQAYYSCNRTKWGDFYPSERWVLERIAGEQGVLGKVLDVGCACGGLAQALSAKFRLASYTGVDINGDAICWASQEQKLSVPANFFAGDIITLKLDDLYDLVVSFSCADWNIETKKIIEACWQRVNEAGHLVISLRLTPGSGVNDIKTSYQYINFSNEDTTAEIANYVVFNFREALLLLQSLQPTPVSIGAFGYWGKPSSTAVTPYDRLVFAVFYLRKGTRQVDEEIKAELNLPIELFL